MPRHVPVAAGYNNLPNGIYIPEIWSKKLQQKYYAATCLDNIVNHDWEGEIKNVGSKVIIRVRPSITTFQYEVGGTIPYQDLDDNSIELLIDKTIGWAFKDDDIDSHQADIDFLNYATEEAAIQTKINIEKDVFSTIYAQTHVDNQLLDAGNPYQVTKNMVLDWIVDAGTLLDEKNVPQDGWYMILPPWICGMIKKSELRDASLTGDDKSVLRNKGVIGMIDRFTIYNSNNLYSSVVGGNLTWHCFCGHKDFCSFASQFVKTELNLRLENTYGNAHRGLNVYGYKVTKPEAGVYMPARK